MIQNIVVREPYFGKPTNLLPAELETFDFAIPNKIPQLLFCWSTPPA
jgi:hypothetical protein